MADKRTIADIFERNVETLTSKPARGFITSTTRARLVHGLRCEIEEGPWRLAADLPVKVGGEGAAPNPGVLGRSALASCLVIGIARWAARMAIPIHSLQVEIEADADARGELGMGEVQPGYTEVRYTIAIDSPAPEHQLAEMLDLAERHSPYLDIFRRPVALRRFRRLNGARG
jgi:uncharacterized OsmC-like protein